jgi:RHS repeat-associated protein
VRKTEAAGGPASSYDYVYDANGRLFRVLKDGVPVEEYAYDENGTRVFEMNTLRGIVNRSYQYSDEDHLLKAGEWTYQYDPDGFLTAKINSTAPTDRTLYSYSARGELLTVILPDGKRIDYVCDPLGRRIAKKVNGVVVEKYLWQGLTRLLAVYNGNNSLLMRFEYADERMPVAMKLGSATYYLSYDQVGSLKLVADASGNVVKRVGYDSFGNILEDSNPSFTIPFGFADGLHDRDTGLVRFGYRDYDPEVGRWNAKDPIGFNGGNTDLYGYVLNDPVNAIDPLGLAWRQMRPLDLPGVRNTTGGRFHHDRFLYDNGDDSGFYGDSTVREDRASQYLQNQYRNAGEYLVDDILRQAEANLRPLWHSDRTAPETPYIAIFHDCQDYADAVMKEYKRLLDELNRQNNSCH